MEPFCQFFAGTRDVVRAYLALDNPRLKEIAEARTGCPIVRLDRFFMEPMNLFFWKNICIFWYTGSLYVYDESQNYIKFNGDLEVVESYIYDAVGYNRLLETVHKVFAELYTGELRVKKGGYTYIWLGSGWATAQLDGIGVYDGHVYTACTSTRGVPA